MYLLDVRTQKLELFLEAQPPPYAILSHRWGSKELNFKDVLKNRVDRETNGYQKMAKACEVASHFGVNYLWIDTCCIDKRSSAELSEAINSMYSWYEKAEICLAYLEDISDAATTSESFVESVWFTRSWTLQELIAPTKLVFYSKDWQVIGDKESKAAAIEARTGIPEFILNKSGPMWECSIADRMSWASDRCATRPEDISYSLMGIFDVNMPLLYGEGTKAFLRLQEEIIRHVSEPTFLSWGLNTRALNLFASSPDDFRHVKSKHLYCSQSTTSFSLTNIGLGIEAQIIGYGRNIYAVIIAEAGDAEQTGYALLLRKSTFGPEYYRCGFATIDRTTIPRTERITIMRGTEQQISEEMEDNAQTVHDHSLHIRSGLLLPFSTVEDIEAAFGPGDTTASMPRNRMVAETYRIFPNPVTPAVIEVQCQPSDTQTLWFEITYDFESRLCLLVSGRSERLRSYKGLLRPSVSDLSDAICDSGRVVRYHGKWKEVRMCQIVDSVTGSIFYFFRSDCPHSFGPIPTELTIGAPSVWFSFVSPWIFADSARLTLSTTPPVPVDEQGNGATT